MNEFRKDAEDEIIVQNSMTFLYTSYEHSKNEIKKIVHSQLPQKQKHPTS